jgi:hypothetical protein
MMNRIASNHFQQGNFHFKKDINWTNIEQWPRQIETRREVKRRIQKELICFAWLTKPRVPR